MRPLSFCAFVLCATACCTARAEALLTCSLSTTPVAFGNYNPLSTVAATSSGSVTVNCLLGLANVTLSLSTGGANSYAPRAMTGPSSLSYNLFTDAMDTHVWGDGSGSTSTVPLTFGILAPPATVTVYGAIPANQSALAGSYSDTIVVTATY